jgi:hypothetical protein
MCRGLQSKTKCLRPFKKATLVRPAESASPPSSSGAALRRAAACLSPRASVRQHYTIVARYVEHSGLLLPRRGLRVARLPRVMIMSAAQRRPCSGNEAGRICSVSTRHAGWLASSGAVVVCAEPFVITVVAATSTKQFARDLACRASQDCDIHVSRRSGIK